MKTTILLFCMMSITLCGGCTPRKLTPVNSKNYEVGKVTEANVGDSMIHEESQSIERGTQWVGILNSESGY